MIVSMTYNLQAKAALEKGGLRKGNARERLVPSRQSKEAQEPEMAEGISSFEPSRYIICTSNCLTMTNVP